MLPLRSRLGWWLRGRADRIDSLGSKNRDVVRVLREMNAQQFETDEGGGREVAWWYYRDAVESALGLEPGALATEDDHD